MSNKVLLLGLGLQTRLVPLEAWQIEQDFLGGSRVFADDNMLKEDLGNLLLFDSAYRDMFWPILSNFELVEGLDIVSIRRIQSQQPVHTLSTITSEQTSSWPANSARVSGCFWGPSLTLLLRPMA